MPLSPARIAFILPLPEPAVRVVVCYADPTCQECVELDLAPGATVADAIEQSGLPGRVPSLDLARHAVGIWGRVVSLATNIHEGDRVEIYRPLAADPRDARRAAAVRARRSR